MKRQPIKERIAAAFKRGITYQELEYAVFPPSEWPKAWNYRSEGGPPACRRVLVAALHRYGYTLFYDRMNKKIVTKIGS